jgi:hypothetical protein
MKHLFFLFLLVAACGKGSARPASKPAPTEDDTPVAKLPPPEIMPRSGDPSDIAAIVGDAQVRPRISEPSPLPLPGPGGVLKLPSMTEGRVSTTGALSPEQVKASFEALTPPFRKCYGDAIKIHEDLGAGSVTVSFTILRSGQVSGAAVVPSDTGSELANPQAEQCVATSFGNLRFPRANDNTQVTFTLSFAPPPS